MNALLQLEQRRIPVILILSFAGLGLSTLITIIPLPSVQPTHPPAALITSVHGVNTEVSAQSTIYIFTFKVASSSNIRAIEIISPASYDVKEAEYIGGLDGRQISNILVSDSKIRLVLQEPIHVPAGNLVTVEIGGISNPSTTGIYGFEIATIDSSGSVVDSGFAYVTISEPSILQNSIKTEHIQDGTITDSKIASSSINLDKLAADVFLFFDDRFTAFQLQITEEISTLQTEFEASLLSEESARATADSVESSTRAAEDENIRQQIQALEEQIEALKEEIDRLRAT